MPETGQKRELALDANILFDLADEKQFAQDFRGFFQAQGFALFIPPTVLAELAFFTECPDERKSSLARKALLGIVKWGLIPYQMKPVGEDITERFSERLREKGLLPPDEKHDGKILGETSLMGVSVLVTRDGDLLDIEETSLALAFQEADLVPVQIMHPGRLLEAAQRVLNL
jgi:predicted nucleic acid-binding protein